MKTKLESRRWLFALLLSGLVCGHGLLWWWLTPPWAAPDEPGHFLYTAQLAQGDTDSWEQAILRSMMAEDWWTYNHLPAPAQPPAAMGMDPTLAASGSQIGQEAPLFYVLAASWWRLHPPDLADAAAQLRWLRLFSLLLRLLLIGGLALALPTLLPGRPARWWGIALLVGLWPMAGFVGGSHNNDVLAMTWGGLTFVGVLAARHPRTRAFVLLPVLAGPLVVDRNLAFLWPFTATWAWCFWLPNRRWRQISAGGMLLVLLLVVLPQPRWASGWRRSQPLLTSRDKNSLYLASARPAPLLSQTLSDKRVQSWRGQTLLLHLVQDEDAPVLLRIRDNEQEIETLCTSPAAPCTLPFNVSPTATFVHVAVSSAQPPVHIRLSLRNAQGQELLFNGNGALPAALDSPFFPWLERRLPVPAGFFDRALAPSAWDVASQLRYSLFAAFAWASFFGWFGWLSRPYPAWLYGLWALGSVMALLGCLQRLPHMLRQARLRALRPVDELFAGSLLATAFLAAQIALPMVGQAWQPQGRYALPGLAPVMALLWLGWEQIWPARRQRWLPIIVTAGLLLANGIAFVVL